MPGSLAILLSVVPTLNLMKLTDKLCANGLLASECLWNWNRLDTQVGECSDYDLTPNIMTTINTEQQTLLTSTEPCYRRLTGRISSTKASIQSTACDMTIRLSCIVYTSPQCSIYVTCDSLMHTMARIKVMTVHINAQECSTWSDLTDTSSLNIAKKRIKECKYARINPRVGVAQRQCKKKKKKKR